MPSVDDPGSPEAVAAGSTCDPVENDFGHGFQTARGVVFHPDKDCPLHGLDALEKKPIRPSALAFR